MDPTVRPSPAGPIVFSVWRAPATSDRYSGLLCFRNGPGGAGFAHRQAGVMGVSKKVVKGARAS